MGTGYYRASILGGMWWPIGQLGSTERVFRAEDDDDAVERAETSEAGDFHGAVRAMVERQVGCGRCWCCLHGRADACYAPRWETVQPWETPEAELEYALTLGEEGECA